MSIGYEQYFIDLLFFYSIQQMTAVSSLQYKTNIGTFTTNYQPKYVRSVTEWLPQQEVYKYM